VSRNVLTTLSCSVDGAISFDQFDDQRSCLLQQYLVKHHRISPLRLNLNVMRFTYKAMKAFAKLWRKRTRQPRQRSTVVPFFLTSDSHALFYYIQSRHAVSAEAFPPIECIMALLSVSRALEQE
jgi:hypothetical protein